MHNCIVLFKHQMGLSTVQCVIAMTLNRQVLRPSKQPESSVFRLLPDGGGVHIALQCQKEIIVMRLFHLRGENGEFSGGNKSVICKCV